MGQRSGLAPDVTVVARLNCIRVENARRPTSLQRTLMCVDNVAQRDAVVLQAWSDYFVARRFRGPAKRSTPLSITRADLPVVKRPVWLLRTTEVTPDLLRIVTVVTPKPSRPTVAARLDRARTWLVDRVFRGFDRTMALLSLLTR